MHVDIKAVNENMNMLMMNIWAIVTNQIAAQRWLVSLD